jgi:hypothetical protein
MKKILGACRRVQTRRRGEPDDDTSCKLQVMRLATSAIQLRRSGWLQAWVTWVPLTLLAVAVASMCLVRGVYGQTGLPGTWEILLQNAGIASMHSAVTRFNTVVLLDRTDIGASQIPLASRYFMKSTTLLMNPRFIFLQDPFNHTYHPFINSSNPCTATLDNYCSRQSLIWVCKISNFIALLHQSSRSCKPRKIEAFSRSIKKK